MILLLSPSKRMYPRPLEEMSLPHFHKEAHQIIENLKSKSKKELNEVLNLSDRLLIETIQMLDEWSIHTSKNSGAAVLSYSGDVYAGLQAGLWSTEDLEYANHHLFILSAVYGILNCKDQISPYRLEMASKLDIDGMKNLYAYWKERVSRKLADVNHRNPDHTIINLASLEYSKVIDRGLLQSPWVDVVFKEISQGKLKVIAYHSKIARGKMASWIIKNRVATVDDLFLFDQDGYSIDVNNSSDRELIFIR